MKRRGLQLSPRHRRILYTVSLVLFLSGVGWAWLHWQDDSGQGGEAIRLWNPWLMKVHGIAAMGFVLLLGTLLPIHVRRSWQAHRNRGNGAFFLTAMGLLTLSGYLLYYLGDETWRQVTSQFHLWLGIGAPFLLLMHIRSGRQTRAAKSHVDP